MKAHVLRGSKQEIAANLTRIAGEVREAIVFEEDSSPALLQSTEPLDIFAEMKDFMVDIEEVNDSREAVYERMDGE
jgi:hypothetical protein